MNDLVSVIIPVYNRQNVVGECVQSIMAQHYQNFEIILIDDGSTDQTLDICRELAQKDPRITLIEADHKGVSAARNKGLENAGGEYVLFVDSDDMIHPLLLKELVQGMKASDAAIAGSGIINVSEKHWSKVKEHMEQDNTPSEITYQNHSETLDAVFHSMTPINLIGGVLIRRDWIGQTRFREDLSIGEDYYFIYENLIKGASTVFLQKKRYYARIHDHNTSWDFGFTGFWSRFLRRELVWKNEEAMGRPEYADCQKREAFGCFLRCLKKNKPGSEDAKKMCRVLRDYKAILLPALSWKTKLHYRLSVYCPGIYLILSHIRQWARELYGKLRRK